MIYFLTTRFLSTTSGREPVTSVKSPPTSPFTQYSWPIRCLPSQSLRSSPRKSLMVNETRVVARDSIPVIATVFKLLIQGRSAKSVTRTPALQVVAKTLLCCLLFLSVDA
ncbi:hypothetical protein CEXT_423371 [Caerostris extrusa]|uniref:Uncharacterized protein n=1 Tax=Caerostris extrusa TaxID=172846 RepID=A0AAV4WZW4_CAEEX|nr:hypothetical protein CEXT_423371 [Caerostris extrusa]